MATARINLLTGHTPAELRRAVTNVGAALSACLELPLERVSVWAIEVPPEATLAGVTTPTTPETPVVEVSVVHGRPKQVLMHLIHEITEGLSHALGGPKERIRVIVTQIDADLWGIGGLPYSAVRAEEMAQRSRAAR